MSEDDRQLLEALKARFQKLPLSKWKRNFTIFLLFCAFFEIFILCFGLDFYDLFVKVVWPWATGILVVLSQLFPSFSFCSPDSPPKKRARKSTTKSGANGANDSFVITRSGKRHRHSSHSRKHDSIYNRAGRFLSFVLLTFLKSGFGSAFILGLVWIVTPSCIAHYKPYSHLIVYVMDICEQTISKQPEQSPAIATPVPTPSTDENELQSNDIPVPHELYTGFLQDPDALWELTSEDYDRIYFQTSEYLVMDWTNQDDVNQTVAQLVRDLCSIDAPNLFDAQAPEELKEEVSQADTSYDQMTRSSQLDATIDTHLQAWAYPKYDIAKLLSYEYQKYALEYYAADGPFDTIEYYYAQSILWAHQAITFSSATDYQVRERLFYISYRYHDIADAAPDGSATQIKASMLCEAYNTVRNLEF